LVLMVLFLLKSFWACFCLSDYNYQPFFWIVEKSSWLTLDSFRLYNFHCFL
jgi:hypothetical protein